MNLCRSLSLALLFVATGHGVAQEPEAPHERRAPNVIIVYADDMGWGDLRALNPEAKTDTPHLDRLVSEGLLCTDAHSSSGICTPSRFALLTGTHHWRRFHGIVNSFGGSVLREDDLTMAELLGAAGYDTACIGKWHLGWDWAAIRRGDAPASGKGGEAVDAYHWDSPVPGGPLDHGFDHYFGDDVPNFPPYGWIRDDRLVEAPTVPLRVSPAPTEGAPESRPGPMVEGWRQDMVMPRLTERVLAWLAEPRRREVPFFLYFPWTSPHAPITPAGEFRGSTEVGGYGDFLRQSDAHLGALLEALDGHGLARDTVVIFTSDNGPEHYAYRRMRRFGHRSAGPLRGLKRDVFEGGHRVPFVVRWPGRIEAGSRSDALLGQVDLLATVASIAGMTLPEGAGPDSLDQLPVWEGAVDSVRSSHVHNTFAETWALRRGKWLFLDAADGAHTRVPKWLREEQGLGPAPEGAWLFDLDADLGQRVNLLREQPELAAEMQRELVEIRKDSVSPASPK